MGTEQPSSAGPDKGHESRQYLTSSLTLIYFWPLLIFQPCHMPRPGRLLSENRQSWHQSPGHVQSMQYYLTTFLQESHQMRSQAGQALYSLHMYCLVVGDASSNSRVLLRRVFHPEPERQPWGACSLDDPIWMFRAWRLATHILADR